MNKHRIYFLAPDVNSAKAIVNELLLEHIEERHIHIVAREGTVMDDLPEAGIAQRTDLIPAIEKGVAAGGLTGLLAGVLAITFPPAGLVLGGGAMLGMTAFGAGFGAWMAGMVGVSLPSSWIEEYADEISAGQLMMMIDVPRNKVKSTEALVLRHHPEARLEGLESELPIFP